MKSKSPNQTKDTSASRGVMNTEAETTTESRDEIAANLNEMFKGYNTERLSSAPKISERKAKRGLPNQSTKRLTRDQSCALHAVAGNCPSCSFHCGSIGDHNFSPIYRRSNSSVTFRCR